MKDNKFCTYNYIDFPIVEVKFYTEFVSDKNFTEFLQEWNKIYNNKKDFIFFFDTRECGSILFKYIRQFADFIKELKKRKKQYLQKSIIIIESKVVSLLLKMLLFFQRPVAPIYVVKDFNTGENLIQKFLENNDNLEDIQYTYISN